MEVFNYYVINANVFFQSNVLLVSNYNGLKCLFKKYFLNLNLIVNTLKVKYNGIKKLTEYFYIYAVLGILRNIYFLLNT